MKPTPLYWGVMAGLFLGSVYLYLFHFLAGEAWSLIPMVPMTFVWSLTMTHEGCHFALSTDWRINLLGSHLSPWLVSSWGWAVQHVIGHHANTNIPAADPDLYHAPANWRYAPDVPWSEMHQNQALIFPIIWSLATFSTAGINELQNPKHYNEVTAMEPRPFWAWGGAFVEIPGRVIAMSLVLYAPMLYFVFLPAYTLSAFMTVVILPTLLWFGLSIFFMAFSQVSHLDEDSIEQSDEDYFKHEVMTTQDYAPDSYFWLFYSVGLNLQAVHHLFPTISYAHHMSLHPILEEVCKKHNVLYSVFPTYSDVFWRYHAQLAKFANNPETYSPDKHPEVGFDFSKILVAISKLANGGTKASIEANDEAAAPNVLAKLPKVIGGITAIVFTLVMLFDTVAATPGAVVL
jgi:fatty acid desaturase